MEKKDFSELFNQECQSYKERIAELSMRLRNIREVGEVQVELFSDRQKVLEYTHKLGQILSKLNQEYRNKKKERLVHWSEKSEGNYRYGSTEKTTLLEGDLAELKYRMELVNNHLSTMNETIKTLDHMLYGIKTRVQLEEFLRQGSVK